MLRYRRQALLVAVVGVALILTMTGCDKLNYGKLRANYHFTNGNKAFTESKWRNAIAEYENALKYNPQMVQAYRFLGESYKQIHRPGVNTEVNKQLEVKAIGSLQKALEIEPNNKDIIYSLGDMYDKLHRFDEAEKLYLRILDLEPTNMSNYYVLADFYKRYAGEKPGAAEKAVAMYLRRIELDPENPQGYAYVANYYENLPATPQQIEMAMKNYDTANGYWERRIQLQPDNAEAWLAKGVNRWGKAYRFQNQPAKERLNIAMDALRAVEKARDLDPNYPEPWSWLSVIYKSLLANLEPEKAGRYNAEADRYIERFQELRKRAAERKKLEEELKKIG